MEEEILKLQLEKSPSVVTSTPTDNNSDEPMEKKQKLGDPFQLSDENNEQEHDIPNTGELGAQIQLSAENYGNYDIPITREHIQLSTENYENYDTRELGEHIQLSAEYYENYDTRKLGEHIQQSAEHYEQEDDIPITIELGEHMSAETDKENNIPVTGKVKSNKTKKV